VHATPEAAQPVAVIVPHEVHLQHFLRTPYTDTNINKKAPFDRLCQDAGVKELILRECISIGRKNGLKGPEILRGVVLSPEEWLPETGLVTAARKLQRPKIVKLFEEEIRVSVYLG
jgi:long-chain acyl-CoA synthetase